MAAAKYDLAIEQGSTFVCTITWADESNNPINLTGYVARAQVRASVSAPETLLELTTENGKIALGGSDGTITLTLTATETAAISWDAGVYDLELESASGFVTRLTGGAVAVSPEVTR